MSVTQLNRMTSHHINSGHLFGEFLGVFLKIFFLLHFSKLFVHKQRRVRKWSQVLDRSKTHSEDAFLSFCANQGGQTLGQKSLSHHLIEFSVSKRGRVMFIISAAKLCFCFPSFFPASQMFSASLCETSLMLSWAPPRVGGRRRMLRPEAMRSA